jgi:hypothetical protein
MHPEVSRREVLLFVSQCVFVLRRCIHDMDAWFKEGRGRGAQLT